jgi:hypothetical protein
MNRLYWRLDRWFNRVGFNLVMRPWARLTHRMLFGWVTSKIDDKGDRQCAREFLGVKPTVKTRIYLALNIPITYLTNPLRAERALRLWLFGGQNRGHWCWNCSTAYHPGIFERLIEGAVLMTGIPTLIAKWYSVYDPWVQSRLKPKPNPFVRPGRFIGLDGPRTEQQESDLIEYQKTGLNPAFRRAVDESVPDILFEPVTGARVVARQRFIVDRVLVNRNIYPTGRTEVGHNEAWFKVEMLVGPNKRPMGYLCKQRTLEECWYKTRASARRAMSRFLKRKGLDNRLTEVEFNSALKAIKRSGVPV